MELPQWGPRNAAGLLVLWEERACVRVRVSACARVPAPQSARRGPERVGRLGPVTLRGTCPPAAARVAARAHSYVSLPKHTRKSKSGEGGGGISNTGKKTTKPNQNEKKSMVGSKGRGHRSGRRPHPHPPCPSPVTPPIDRSIDGRDGGGAAGRGAAPFRGGRGGAVRCGEPPGGRSRGAAGSPPPGSEFELWR